MANIKLHNARLQNYGWLSYIICFALIFIVNVILNTIFSNLEGYMLGLTITVIGLCHPFLKKCLLNRQEPLNISDMEKFIKLCSKKLFAVKSAEQLENIWFSMLKQRFVTKVTKNTDDSSSRTYLVNNYVLIAPSLYHSYGFKLSCKKNGYYSFSKSDIYWIEVTKSLLSFVYQNQSTRESMLNEQQNVLFQSLDLLITQRLQWCLTNAKNIEEEVLIKNAINDLKLIVSDSNKSVVYYPLIFCLNACFVEMNLRLGCNVVDITNKLERNSLQKIVSSALFHELSQYFREATNNILKHSYATKVSLLIDAHPVGFMIVMENNNCISFSPGILTGNGLIGMQCRLQKIKGEFRYSLSKELNSFKLIAIFPLVTVYD